MWRIIFIFLLGCCSTRGTWAQQVGQPLPVWQAGQLEIHHISTGQGNATLAILPDGTTLLIDAGAINPRDWRTNQPRNLPIRPNADRQAGEWIARYIRKALRFQAKPAIDYAVITHFHDDHLGSPLHGHKVSAGGYVLAGISEVAEYLPIRKILDRGWPDYAYPRSLASDSMVANYRRFLGWQRENRGLLVERFAAGRTNQIRLTKKRRAYRQQFSLQNIIVNGQIWTGVGQSSRPLFPDLATVSPAQYPTENMCSIGLLMRYGAFSYFAGGDLTGVLQASEPAWHDVESPVGRVVGPVSVQVLDHHGYPDAENAALLASLRPRVLVIPAWAASHPAPSVLERIYSAQGYTGARDVFTTSLAPEARASLGDWLLRLKNTAGHVVVKVEPGGQTYYVLIVADTDEEQRVLAVHGPYTAR